MLPYWFLFAIFAAGATGTRTRANFGSWNPILIVAGIVAALMVGYRDHVGADWNNYEQIYFYTGISQLGEALSMVDPAYALLNWISFALDLGIWPVNLVCSAIFIAGLLKFANQQPNPWLCTLVSIPYLVIVVGMGYTRQAVALGFILMALSNFERHSLVRFIALMVCAAAFHKTAIVVLPLVAFATMRNRFIVFATLGAVGFLLFTFFFEKAMGIISASYLEQDYDASGAMIRVFMNVGPAILFLIYKDRFQLSPIGQRLWRNFAFSALAMVPLLFIATSSVIVDRLAIYLIPLQLLVFGRLPWVFLSRGKPNAQIALAVILYSGLVQFVWMNFAGHAEYWLPYRFYPLAEPYVEQPIEQ